VITFEESSDEMEAMNLEATPEETEAAVERQELFKEEMNYDNNRSSEDRCKDQHLAVRRRRGAKKWSGDIVGSQQKLSAACKRVKRCAVPAGRKGQVRKGPGRNNVARGTSRRKTLEKGLRNNFECKNGTWDRDFKKRLWLRLKRTSERITRKPRELTSLLGLLFAIHEVNEMQFWKVWPPPKCKKELQTV
jgi:hypothetical protein